MRALRDVGGAAGLLLGLGIVVGLGLVLSAPWQVVVFFAFLFGLVGARIGSRTLPSIGEHKLFLQVCPLLGALGGFFLGIVLIHGIPAQGDFGWPVVVCCALLAGLGLVLPFVVLSKLVPVRCPHCGGRSYLGTDSTFFRKMLAKYHYRCRSCGHVEEMNFNNPVQ